MQKQEEQTYNQGTGHIIQSLIVNLLIACSKGVAAFMTGSGAMLAETIHSFSDCANQALLLVGVRQARRPADEIHPLGYGRSAYFWSFMVAMLLFSIGGMFSIYEGVHKYKNPEPVNNILWGVGILAFSLALEGYATFSNIVELKKRKKDTGFFAYLRLTKDSDLIVIFGENSAAVLGLIVALCTLIIAYYTGDGRYDAIGSIIIGVILIAVAIFLAREVKSLLIGESADLAIYGKVKELTKNHPNIKELINCRTIQQGPNEVLVCAKILIDETLNAVQISRLINEFEADLRGFYPEVKWLYIEPDLQEWKEI
jgi:cation diffusion facilitator family transporter